MTALRIGSMGLDDLKVAIDWATAEGWNPGLEDASAFLAADPGGFLMGWLEDEPVTAISVVRHSDTFGFLGFYLCHPEHRGKGYGWATWQAGMAHLGARAVGLDGVPAQQANYERSGFVLAHHTKRYAGKIEGRPDPELHSATRADIDALLQSDSLVSRTDRSAYLSAWFEQAETRKTLILPQAQKISAIGTIRACRQGHKIGPLFASDADDALRMIRALVDAVGASDVMIDVPDPNQEGVSLVGDLGLESVFSCARMYRGTPLVRQVDLIFGETTFELG